MVGLRLKALAGPGVSKEKRAVGSGPVHFFVYARHGRELVGLKSPVSVPVLSEELSINY